MITVVLQGAEFFAYHGYYPEEQLLGCHFVVDLSVSFDPGNRQINDDLENTLNYEQLYSICCDEMVKTRKLIETVAHDIVESIKKHHPFVLEIELIVKKMNPPIKGKIAYSGIKLNYSK